VTRESNPWALRHGRRARERLNRAYELVRSNELARAREELVLARDDFNDARDPGPYRHVARVLDMDDGDLRRHAKLYFDLKRAFPGGLNDAARWSMSVNMNRARGRSPNVDPGTAAVVTGAIGATTMSTIQAMANNPSVRYTAVRSGDAVAIVRGGGKMAAMARLEGLTGVGADRGTARTFDTKREAMQYARLHLGEPTLGLDLTPSPEEIRAIKRRVLR